MRSLARPVLERAGHCTDSLAASAGFCPSKEYRCRDFGNQHGGPVWRDEKRAGISPLGDDGDDGDDDFPTLSNEGVRGGRKGTLLPSCYLYAKTPCKLLIYIAIQHVPPSAEHSPRRPFRGAAGQLWPAWLSASAEVPQSGANRCPFDVSELQHGGPRHRRRNLIFLFRMQLVFISKVGIEPVKDGKNGGIWGKSREPANRLNC